MRVPSMIEQVSNAGISLAEYNTGKFMAECVISCGARSRNALLPGSYKNGGSQRRDDLMNDIRRSEEEKY